MFRKILIASTGLVFLVVVVLGGFFLLKIFRPKFSGLLVDSTPPSRVILNGVEAGMTPYRNKKLIPGDYSLKLIPKEAGFPVFDTKLDLADNIETVVKHQFADSQEYSSTEMITFEKIDPNQSEISIITLPTGASVLMNGQARGITPLSLRSVEAGGHKILITLNGYVSKDIEFRTYKGFRLIAYAILAKDRNLVPTQTPTPEMVWYIEILETPTGFLRVRKEPSTVAEEVGQVVPGEKYRLLEEDKQIGWFKIEYGQGLEGWISNKFAKRVLALNENTENSFNLKEASPSSTLSR